MSVLKLGGAENCNSFTKFYLAALGQISYDACPSIPPGNRPAAQVPLFQPLCRLRLVAHHDPAAGDRHHAPARRGNFPNHLGIQELYRDYSVANSPIGRLKSLPRSCARCSCSWT